MARRPPTLTHLKLEIWITKGRTCLTNWLNALPVIYLLQDRETILGINLTQGWKLDYLLLSSFKSCNSGEIFVNSMYWLYSCHQAFIVPIFGLFRHFQTNNLHNKSMLKCLSSIWRRASNSQPLDYESTHESI